MSKVLRPLDVRKTVAALVPQTQRQRLDLAFYMTKVLTGLDKDFRPALIMREPFVMTLGTPPANLRHLALSFLDSWDGRANQADETDPNMVIFDFNGDRHPFGTADMVRQFLATRRAAEVGVLLLGDAAFLKATGLLDRCSMIFHAPDDVTVQHAGTGKPI